MKVEFEVDVDDEVSSDKSIVWSGESSSFSSSLYRLCTSIVFRKGRDVLLLLLLLFVIGDKKGFNFD